MNKVLCQACIFLLFVAPTLRADNVLFIGNSFTYGATVPLLKKNGGVPKLFEAIARAKGHSPNVVAVVMGNEGWNFHLAQPKTRQALATHVWDWVVLQDFSTRATHIGNVANFMKDGETFSDKIAQNSPKAGIVLYETWARPAGAFFQKGLGATFSGPDQMMAELHQNYGNLQRDLEARNSARPVRVALVGTSFALIKAKDPLIVVDAADHHHATLAGYYEAALLMDETIYHESVRDAPRSFFGGQLVIPENDAKELQMIADQVEGSGPAEMAPVLGTLSGSAVATPAAQAIPTAQAAPP
jgi:hypothetical protein